MFGISSIGWVHTLGSLPAIPLAIYMFIRHGRIAPRTPAGKVYFVAMLVGASTVFPVAHAPVSYAIATLTLVLLFVGYVAHRMRSIGRAAAYVETIALSLTAFLLMLPAVTETLRRIPDGHPLAPSLSSPLLVGAQTGLLLALVIGVTAQVIYLRKRGAHPLMNPQAG